MTIKTTPKNKKKDGRTIDLTLQWLVNNHGQEVSVGGANIFIVDMNKFLRV